MADLTDAPVKPMPAVVRRLLDAAYDAMESAKKFQDQGKHADALALALFANEYVRAAKAIAGIQE